MTLTKAYVGEIVKRDRTESGDLMIYGKATGPDLDLDGERCDPAWLKSAMPKWYEWGNIREMHGTVAAGVGVELVEDGDDWYVKALITDKDTAHKIETGTLKGLSIGAIGARTFKDARGQRWLTDGEIIEISAVDRPCNPTCTLDLAKSADGKAGPLLPVDSAGHVIATVTKAVQLDKDKAPTDDKTVAAPVPFDRGAALAVATAVLRKDRAGATELALKAVGADGARDEAPDIAGGRAVIAQLARLISAEADELAAGYLGESCDITLLVQAVENVKWWLRKEEAAAGDDSGLDDAVVFVGFKADPDVTKDAPAEPAVPPAPEPAPTEKPAEADTTKTAASSLDADAMQKIADAAVRKALAPLQAENESLRGELAQLKSTVKPGSPYVVAPPAAPVNEAANKAAEYRQIAANATDPGIREAYRALAARTEADAAPHR